MMQIVHMTFEYRTIQEHDMTRESWTMIGVVSIPIYMGFQEGYAILIGTYFMEKGDFPSIIATDLSTKGHHISLGSS